MVPAIPYGTNSIDTWPFRLRFEIVGSWGYAWSYDPSNYWAAPRPALRWRSRKERARCLAIRRTRCAERTAERLRVRRLVRGDRAERALRIPVIRWARRVCSPAERYRVITPGAA